MKPHRLSHTSSMLDAEATFQLEMSWLKAVASLNVHSILATLATFHLLMSPLNVGLLLNSEAMLVTAAVFQSVMLPYVAAAVVGLVAHSVAAVPMLPFVMVVCACATSVKAQLKMSTAPMNRRRFMLGGYVDSRGRHFDFGGRT